MVIVAVRLYKKNPQCISSSSPVKRPPMASSSSLAPLTVTKEQFKTFHNIDRILFTKLVHYLGRNSIESMQVVALWIWLEHSGLCRGLVNTLLTWPDTSITSLADEAVLCLSCVQSDESFPFSLQNIEVIPLTQSITKGRVTLSFLRDNRLKILRAVTKNVIEVCARAFEDLVLHEVQNKAIIRDENAENSLRGNENMVKQQLGDYGPIVPVVSYYDAVAQRQHDVLRNGVDGLLRRMQISTCSSEEKGNHGDQVTVPPEERTIFLTFSKGYPISENEITDFFVRKFGQCFEAIRMQEVASSTEQPLFARLVMDSASFMDVVLGGKSKAKFSINGKHVWARKYVRKNHRSPPQPSSPSQLPSSPKI